MKVVSQLSVIAFCAAGLFLPFGLEMLDPWEEQAETELKIQGYSVQFLASESPEPPVTNSRGEDLENHSKSSSGLDLQDEAEKQPANQEQPAGEAAIHPSLVSSSRKAIPLKKRRNHYCFLPSLPAAQQAVLS